MAPAAAMLQQCAWLVHSGFLEDNVMAQLQLMQLAGTDRA